VGSVAVSNGTHIEDLSIYQLYALVFADDPDFA